MTITNGTVLVTGASSGIGLETALHLAKAGFRVVATVRALSRAARLEQEAGARNVVVHVMELDCTDHAAVDRVIGEIVDQFGSIYGLVNNAGVILRGYFEDVSDAEMRSVFETNLFGSMNVTRTVLPRMRAAGRGRVVIMSSTGGLLATPGNSAYCASKFALEGFGEALRQELAPFGIWTSLVEPGFIRTELFSRNRRTAEAAGSEASPYFEWFQKLERLTDEQVRKAATPPAAVAEVVRRILESPQPKLRYVVGSRARLLLSLRRYLPGETFDRIWLPEITRRLSPAKAGKQ